MKTYNLIYKGSDGKPYWVDKEGDISLDSVEMTEAEAENAADAFMKTCHPSVLHDLLEHNAELLIVLEKL